MPSLADADMGTVGALDTINSMDCITLSNRDILAVVGPFEEWNLVSRPSTLLRLSQITIAGNAAYSKTQTLLRNNVYDQIYLINSITIAIKVCELLYR